jgi:hypothetical protein
MREAVACLVGAGTIAAEVFILAPKPAHVDSGLQDDEMCREQDCSRDESEREVEVD